jgi:hypothetical protein
MSESDWRDGLKIGDIVLMSANGWMPSRSLRRGKVDAISKSHGGTIVVGGLKFSRETGRLRGCSSSGGYGCLYAPTTERLRRCNLESKRQRVRMAMLRVNVDALSDDKLEALLQPLNKILEPST